MISKEQAQEKIASGWLQALLSFEVLAVNEQTAKESLQNLIEKLDKDERAKIYKKEFFDVEEVETPLPKISKGFSQICEVELVCKHFEELIGIIIEYGPSACEILKPGKITIEIGEAQNILNAVGEMMHRFAEAGLGGLIITTGK